MGPADPDQRSILLTLTSTLVVVALFVCGMPLYLHAIQRSRQAAQAAASPPPFAAKPAPAPAVPPPADVPDSPPPKLLPPEPFPAGDLPAVSSTGHGFTLRACSLPRGYTWWPVAATLGCLALWVDDGADPHTPHKLEVLKADSGGVRISGEYLFLPAAGGGPVLAWPDGRVLQWGQKPLEFPDADTPLVEARLSSRTAQCKPLETRFSFPAGKTEAQLYASGDSLLTCADYSMINAPYWRIYRATPDGQNTLLQRVWGVRTAGAVWSDTGPAPLLVTRRGAVLAYDAAQKQCVERPELAALAAQAQDGKLELPLVVARSFAVYAVKDAWEVRALDGPETTDIALVDPVASRPGLELERLNRALDAAAPGRKDRNDRLALDIQHQQLAQAGRAQPATSAARGSSAVLVGPDEVALLDPRFSRITLITPSR
jgi:hypothetical protein